MTADDGRRNVRADVRPHAPARIGTPALRTSAWTDEPIRLLLTIPEAAAVLRISRTKFYELLDAGDIESIHIGRSRKIPADALAAYIDRLRIPQPRKDTT